jgi:hypothetical protein
MPWTPRTLKSGDFDMHRRPLQYKGDPNRPARGKAVPYQDDPGGRIGALKRYLDAEMCRSRTAAEREVVLALLLDLPAAMILVGEVT